MYIYYAYRHLWYERVYLPLGEVADTPFYIRRDDIIHENISISKQHAYFILFLNMSTNYQSYYIWHDKV